MFRSSLLNRAFRFTLLSGLYAFSTPPVSAAERLVVGQYEFAVTRDGKTQTFTQCITAADAKSVNADAKTGRALTEAAGKGACTIRAYDLKDDTVSYTMVCGDGVISSSATYHGDHFEGDTTTTTTLEGKALAHLTHTKAKRVGACK